MESIHAQEETNTITGFEDMINYYCISIYFGLHKDSYNYMHSNSLSSKMRSYPKLKQTYNSIQPVKEEERSQDSAREKSSFARTLNVSKQKKMNRVTLNNSVSMENAQTPKIRSVLDRREGPST